MYNHRYPPYYFYYEPYDPYAPYFHPAGQIDPKLIKPTSRSKNRLHKQHARQLSANKELMATIRPNPNYPEIDETTFHQSATEYKKLLDEASLFIDQLTNSREFCHDVMEAAQRGDKEKVNKLIKSAGITSDVKTTFNPEEIRVELRSKSNGMECCLLVIALRW